MGIRQVQKFYFLFLGPVLLTSITVDADSNGTILVNSLIYAIFGVKNHYLTQNTIIEVIHMLGGISQKRFSKSILNPPLLVTNTHWVVDPALA